MNLTPRKPPMQAPNEPRAPVPAAPPAEAPARWTMVYLARRNPALAAGEFVQAWREHSALGRQCRNVQDKVLGVTQCARLRDSGEDGGLPGASTTYDGVNLLQLRNLAAATELWSDPETLATMRPDEPRVFSTYVRDFTLVCRERVLRDAPPTGVVLFGFVRRSASVSAAQFQAAWTDDPAEAWLAAPALAGALRVVHHAVVQTPPVGYEYDGIAEWWFDSADAARTALSAPARADLRRQLPSAYQALADLDASVFVFTQVTHRRP